ncbi:MAG: hypothetical protein GY847_06370 [Proteobacteria bacterium]|nr:hypothetical protein [Pseudomonadota bacterium]
MNPSKKNPTPKKTNQKSRQLKTDPPLAETATPPTEPATVLAECATPFIEPATLLAECATPFIEPATLVGARRAVPCATGSWARHAVPLRRAFLGDYEEAYGRWDVES